MTTTTFIYIFLPISLFSTLLYLHRYRPIITKQRAHQANSGRSFSPTTMLGGPHCLGKQAWPELVGEKAEVAKETIERENPSVRARFIKQGHYRTMDFRCDRVWVWTTQGDTGLVVEVPKVG